MKKTLSLMLALVFVVAAFAAAALVPDAAGTPNQFEVYSILVSDVNGYTNPYIAVDNANAFIENQPAYVVVQFRLHDIDAASDTVYAAVTGDNVTSITSSTLDLAYAKASLKIQTVDKDGNIAAAGALGVNAIWNAVTLEPAYDSTTNTLKLTAENVATAAAGAALAKNQVIKYYFTFIGITKPATAGEVKASLAVSGVKFGDVTFANATPLAAAKTLVVYDSALKAKYTVVELAAAVGHGKTFRVFNGKVGTASTIGELKAAYAFDFVQTATLFEYIGYAVDPTVFNAAGVAVGFTYDGKLVYLGADSTLGTADDVDLTARVTDCNTFFGFSFATSNPAAYKDFETKTSGNPVIKTDTYAYVTAAVETLDDDVDIAVTGDFSANIVIVLAASAVLAAAALAFVAKKARD